ncbi:hypothetical protein G7046_g3148 [Stylonectria norvegica]|nr:hypothetical protein G7046_g3148 [Stylonectria norvegica]
MKTFTLIYSCVALFLPVVSAESEYDATICNQKRFGTFTDSLMYYPNAWNDKSPKDGFVCMKVDNSTPAYDATWNWDTDIQDVHSFPYVSFSSVEMPILLSNLTSIRLATDWIMTPGSPSEPPRTFTSSVWEKNKKELGNTVQANAAWDFFLDDNRNTSMFAQDAAIEFMVWLGRIGDPWWLGRLNNTLLSNVTLGDTEFSLYYGRNTGGTHVFTAVTSDSMDVTSLDEDFYPLFEFILKQARNHPEVPDDLPKNPYLGVVEFGTETWRSDGNVTFTAANFGMKLNQEVYSNKGSSSNDSSTGDNDTTPAANSSGSDGSSDSSGDKEDGAAALRGMAVLGFQDFDGGICADKPRDRVHDPFKFDL